MGKAHDQLKLIRETLGFSQAEMAEKLGAGRASSYAYYEDPKGYKGTTIPDRLIEAMLSAADAGVFGDKKELVQKLLGPALYKFRDKLTDADVKAALHVDSPWPGFALVGVYYLQHDFQVKAFLNDGTPDDWTIIRETLLHGSAMGFVPEELFVLRISHPGQFPPFNRGDEFLVDRTFQNITRDGIYLIVDQHNRAIVRRITFDLSTNEAVASLDGSGIPPIRYARPENLRVLGRVIWQGRSLHSTVHDLERDPHNPPPKPVAEYPELAQYRKQAQSTKK